MTDDDRTTYIAGVALIVVLYGIGHVLVEVLK